MSVEEIKEGLLKKRIEIIGSSAKTVNFMYNGAKHTATIKKSVTGADVIDVDTVSSNKNGMIVGWFDSVKALTKGL